MSNRSYLTLYAIVILSVVFLVAAAAAGLRLNEIWFAGKPAFVISNQASQAISENQEQPEPDSTAEESARVDSGQEAAVIEVGETPTAMGHTIDCPPSGYDWVFCNVLFHGHSGKAFDILGKGVLVATDVIVGNQHEKRLVVIINRSNLPFRVYLYNDALLFQSESKLFGVDGAMYYMANENGTVDGPHSTPTPR